MPAPAPGATPHQFTRGLGGWGPGFCFPKSLRQIMEWNRHSILCPYCFSSYQRSTQVSTQHRTTDKSFFKEIKSQ